MVSALLAIFAVFGVISAHSSGESPRFDDFLRFVETPDGGGMVQTSIVTYRDLRGTEVQLIGAVHVGEKEYYRELQNRFGSLDAVLYEMVKPTEATADSLRGSNSSVSGLQRLMKTALGLEFQLDAIDYTPKHFIHADMTPDSFARAQKEQGESLAGLMFKAMMEQQATLSPGDTIRENLRFLAAITNRNRTKALKMYLGRQIGDMEKAVIGLQGDDESGSVLLEGRNRVAIDVLRTKALPGGFRRIGIFYGAAHMPDMEKRLEKLGFRRVGVEWLVAWDMTR